MEIFRLGYLTLELSPKAVYIFGLNLLTVGSLLLNHWL